VRLEQREGARHLGPRHHDLVAALIVGDLVGAEARALEQRGHLIGLPLVEPMLELDAAPASAQHQGRDQRTHCFESYARLARARKLVPRPAPRLNSAPWLASIKGGPECALAGS
jgi:hypothetical protein